MEKIKADLVNIGKPAVPAMIELLNDREAWMSSDLAAEVLGEIGDSAYRALKNFGSACIPEVIKRVENRLGKPLKTNSFLDSFMLNALSGGEFGWEDNFKEEYGEYFDED